MSTTKACKNHFPVLLCTTKLAQNTSQYYFVLQSLHKALPSTTLYYKACTKHVPVLLCTTKLLHTSSSFAEKLLHTEAFTHNKLLHREAFTHSKRLHTEHLHTVLLHMASVYTQKLLHRDAFTHREAFTHSKLLHKICFTQQAFKHSKHLHTEHLHTVLLHMASVYTHSKLFKQRSFYTQQAFTQRSFTQQAFTHRSFYTQQASSQRSFHTQQAFTHRHTVLLHMASAYTHSKLFKQRSFYTQQAFTQRSFYTQQAFTHSKRLHTEHLRTVLLHMASVYTHRNFYTETLLHTEKLLHTASFYRKSFCTEKLSCTSSQQELQLQNWISTPKRQKDDFEALFKRNFKRKIEKICWQITFAALMQPFQYDLRSSAAKDNSITHAAAAPSNLDAATTMRSAETELQNTIELRAMASEIAAPKPDGSRRQSDKKTILKHFLKGILKGKLLAPKLRKSADNSLSQPWCSHSNTIYDLQLQKTIVLRMQPLHQATLTQPLQCDLHRRSCKTQ